MEETEKETFAYRVEAEKRTQDSYIDNLKEGILIAVAVNHGKLISVMVESVNRDNEGKVSSVTAIARNGAKFQVPRESIKWVKTGKRWPRSIFEQFKGTFTKEE